MSIKDTTVKGRTLSCTTSDGHDVIVIKSKQHSNYGITTEKPPRVFSFKSNKILKVDEETGEFHMKVNDKNKAVSLATFAEQCRTD